jgi:peptidoglycan/xylan/chitin deacetylase (PgdA/CDA1 family)
MYHRIDYRENDTLSVSPEIFAIQMKYLKENNYDVIPLSELVNVIKNRKKYSRKIVAITFDDGYANNFLYAFPILSKYNFPATIFLITNKVGESKEFVNWDQVRLMAKNGITFGAHTRNHAYLPDVRDPGKLRDEICGSKTDIERNIGCQVNFFCYPVGGFNGSVVKTVKEAGYEAAFTTNRGMDKFNKNLFELQRIKIMNKPFHFRIQLSGYYNLLREVKKGD